MRFARMSLAGTNGPRTGPCNEAVLAREVLRLAGCVQELETAPDGLVAYNYVTEGHRRLREALQVAGLWRPREDGQGGAIDCAIEALVRLAASEQEALQLTDRLNALTARIEEALDLLIHETENSRRVEQAYRMLEKVMMDNLGKEISK